MPRTTLATIVLSMFAVLATASPAQAGEFPDDWFWGKPAQRARHNAVVGKPAPPLSIATWHGDSVTPESMRGKVVVVDLWATWCGPCRRALPKNVAMVDELADQGLVVVGVHDHKSGVERIDAVIESSKINFPVGVDDSGKTARAYALAFWPTYAVVDRTGVVRAVGLKPERVRSVVELLLAEPTPGESNADAAGPAAKETADARSSMRAVSDVASGAVSAEWLEGDAKKRRRLESLAGSGEVPPLPTDTEWINSEPLVLDDLDGKVVLLDFWATWCGPCRKAVPKTNELMEKYGEKGLVIVGVCHNRGSDKMAETVKSLDIRYPVVADTAKHDTVRAYVVDGYPDYYLIDRQGRLRVIDCANRSVESAVEALLAEG